MTVISFKSDDEFKARLEHIARTKGINTSAYIKLVLTKAMKEDHLEELAFQKWSSLGEAAFDFWNNPDDDHYSALL